MDDILHINSVPAEKIDDTIMTLLVYPEESLLFLEWKFQISLEERQVTFFMALDLTNKYQIRNWLISNRYISFVSPEEKNWMVNEWIGTLSQSCLRKQAVVCPENYYKLVITLDLTHEAQQQFSAQGNIQHRVFMEYEAAINWLLF